MAPTQGLQGRFQKRFNVGWLQKTEKKDTDLTAGLGLTIAKYVKPVRIRVQYGFKLVPFVTIPISYGFADPTVSINRA